MKRSRSEPNLPDKTRDAKKAKPIKGPNTREYLQLALAKVLEMQREIKENSYSADNTSDLGESENEEDAMKEVLTKVFKDLPGSSHSTVSVIENAMKQRDPRLDAIRSKSAQLAGYDTCHRVAVDFMKNAAKHAPTSRADSHDLRLEHYSRHQSPANFHRRLNATFEPGEGKLTASGSDHEIRMRMLRSLDLHLASKQRDYVAKLMRQ